MRVSGYVIAVIGLAWLAFGQVVGQTPDAAAVLGRARQALGGEERLAAVKTFVATGRIRQVRGDNLVPIEFEISCELPDKYIRRDEVPAQDTGPTTTGFSGTALIQRPPPADPMMPAPAGGPPPPTPAQLEATRHARLVSLQQDFARLMLGMFAGSSSSVPLTFTYVGTAEAPQGQADVLAVKGPANFAGRFFVYKTTHLPIMVSWQAAPGGPPPGPSPPSGPQGGPVRRVAPPGAPTPAMPSRTSSPGDAPSKDLAETRLYFADYRDVDGVKWPFRIRRAVGADTIEETNVDRFRINVKIDPKKFDVK